MNLALFETSDTIIINFNIKVLLFTKNQVCRLFCFKAFPTAAVSLINHVTERLIIGRGSGEIG